MILLGSLPVQPDLVAARVDNGLWSVPVTLGASETRFLLSTSVSTNIADRSLLLSPEGGELPVRIGAVSLGDQKIDPGTFSQSGTRGVLGVAAFRKRLIGFDFDTEEIALWPSGTELESARSWVRDLPGGGDPATVELKVFQNGVPSVQTKVGDRDLWVLLSSGYSATLISRYVPPAGEFLKVRDMPSTDVLSGTVAPGQYGVFGPLALTGGRPLYIGASVAASDLSQYDAPLDGVLKLEDLGSRRIVLDLEHHHLLVEANADANASLAASISTLLAVPFQIKDNRLVLAHARNPRFAEALRPLANLPVISIDGISAAESLAALKAGGATALKEAARLQKARSTGYVLVLNGADGIKRVEVEAS